MKRIHGSKFLVFMLLMIISAVSLFAGGEKEGSAPAKPKLVMLFSAGGSGNSLKSSAERFGELYGVEIEALLFSITEVYEKEVLALTSRQGTPDIISMDDTWFPLMKDFLEELNFSQDYYDQFIPSMLGTFRWPQNESGKQYGIPVRMGGEVIVYREDVFRAAGIDPLSLKTWEDLYAAGQKVTDRNNGVWGWVGGYSEPAYITAIWLNIMSSYGVDIFNDDMTGFVFNTPQGVAATQMFVNLTANLASPGILSYGYAEEIEALQNGSAVMGQLWSARYSAVDKAGLPNTGKFKVLPFYPYGRNSGLTTGVDRVNGWGLGVNKNSKNKEIAAKFLEFIGSYEEQLRLAVETSNSPVLSGIFNESSYLEAVPEAKNMELAMKDGIARPMHIKWQEIEGSIALNLQKAVIGELTAAEALAKAEADAIRILSR
ncbi:ABC transporter substrate-binding protein [Breznakiella homolactica]|uniref:Sugar ABC transporter substrate-binding protein n=1 Tax=Breznakiella homolactica TaxID=2798577 RepID=A0A7T8BAH5_9SPIR|nr:sugar ABC transporter substrate-binding protein [Breznakiella homolactica]QQO10684.1 sugar ABC transporter substrate-binding protein [Breznakiella homolactica]